MKPAFNVSGKISYLQNGEIDRQAWDDCVSRAPNGLVYAYSYYLDAMAGDWDGLVLNNYEAIMPLPWRRKWGVFYLYQPFLVAQGGVFGEEITGDLLHQFLAAVPKRFRYWDFPLNHANLFQLDNYSLFQRSNYVLLLQQPYTEIEKHYRENIKRNRKKCFHYGCTIATNIPIDKVIALTLVQTGEAATTDLENFKQLYTKLQQQSLAKTYGVLSKQGELLASAAFLFSHNRAYYLLVGNHPNGRTLGASHALIDAFISDHAGKDLVLDFEGSDLRNLAFFYSSFGAKEEKYAAIKRNALPWWAKWLKK